MKFNNMKIIIGLCVGLSMTAVAQQPTTEQKNFLHEIGNTIKTIVAEVKIKFANLKDKKNKKSLLKNHIPGFVQINNTMKNKVIKPLEQMQTRGQADTFDQAAVLFKEIVQQLVDYVEKITTTITDAAKVSAGTKKSKRAKAENIAKKLKAMFDKIKKSNDIKKILNKIKELQKLLVTIELQSLAKQVQQIHDLCQDVIANKKPMKNSEKLAFVTAIANKL